MRPTQQERKAETRARLLAAATELFSERGIDAVSVDAVAERAGRTSGAIYAHFGSKQGLLLALLESWKDSALTVLMAEVAVSGTAEDQLRAVWKHIAHVGQGPDAPDGVRLEQELWLRASRDPSVADVLRRRHDEARRFSAAALAGWADAHGARPVATPDDLALLVRALLTGLAGERRLDPDVVDDELVLVGLRALLGLPAPAAEPPNDHPEPTSNPVPQHRPEHQGARP